MQICILYIKMKLIGLALLATAFGSKHSRLDPNRTIRISASGSEVELMPKCLELSIYDETVIAETSVYRLEKARVSGYYRLLDYYDGYLNGGWYFVKTYKNMNVLQSSPEYEIWIRGQHEKYYAKAVCQYERATFIIPHYSFGDLASREIYKNGSEIANDFNLMKNFITTAIIAINQLHVSDITHRNIRPSSFFRKVTRDGEDRFILGRFEKSVRGNYYGECDPLFVPPSHAQYIGRKHTRKPDSDDFLRVGLEEYLILLEEWEAIQPVDSLTREQDWYCLGITIFLLAVDAKPDEYHLYSHLYRNREYPESIDSRLFPLLDILLTPDDNQRKEIRAEDLGALDLFEGFDWELNLKPEPKAIAWRNFIESWASERGITMNYNYYDPNMLTSHGNGRVRW